MIKRNKKTNIQEEVCARTKRPAGINYNNDYSSNKEKC